MKAQTPWVFFSITVFLLFLGFMLSLTLGSVSVSPGDVYQAICGELSKENPIQIIVRDYRLPKALTAILCGAALSLSGLLMQTLFRNPLAGPFVLGISSGASLGVALLLLGAGIGFPVFAWMADSGVAIAIAASMGSFLVLLAVSLASWRIRDTMGLLIVGLMFSSLTSALVGVLAYFSPAEKLQQYVFWSFGSLGNLSWTQLGVLVCLVIPGIVLSVFGVKTLNALLLGEQYARTLGVNIARKRFLLIIATSLLAGSVTAFAGPIAFVGLAVPHLSRLWLKTANHRILIPGTLLLGATLLLYCDLLAQWPFDERTLPVNAITSIFGAPLVIYLLMRRRKLLF